MRNSIYHYNCNHCEGKGWIVKYGMHGQPEEQESCDFCSGRGMVIAPHGRDLLEFLAYHVPGGAPFRTVLEQTQPCYNSPVKPEERHGQGERRQEGRDGL